jgi:hypothetical protein
MQVQSHFRLLIQFVFLVSAQFSVSVELNVMFQSAKFRDSAIPCDVTPWVNPRLWYCQFAVVAA